VAVTHPKLIIWTLNAKRQVPDRSDMTCEWNAFYHSSKRPIVEQAADQHCQDDDSEQDAVLMP